MAQPVTLKLALAAASATAIAAAQSLGAAGNLTINGSAASGGVATLDVARRVLLSSVGNDSGTTFVVTGTNQSGAAISESLKGATAGNTVATQQDFLTVTQVSASAATAGNVSVGTNTTGSTPWQAFNEHITPPFLGLGFEVLSGSVTATVEYTYDAFLPPMPIYAAPTVPVPAAVPKSDMQAMTSAQDGVINFPIRAWRLTVTSGTGTAQLTGIQAGIRN